MLPPPPYGGRLHTNPSQELATTLKDLGTRDFSPGLRRPGGRSGVSDQADVPSPSSCGRVSHTERRSASGPLLVPLELVLPGAVGSTGLLCSTPGPASGFLARLSHGMVSCSHTGLLFASKALQCMGSQGVGLAEQLNSTQLPLRCFLGRC